MLDRPAPSAAPPDLDLNAIATWGFQLQRSPHRPIALVAMTGDGHDVAALSLEPVVHQTVRTLMCEALRVRPRARRREHPTRLGRRLQAFELLRVAAAAAIWGEDATLVAVGSVVQLLDAWAPGAAAAFTASAGRGRDLGANLRAALAVGLEAAPTASRHDA